MVNIKEITDFLHTLAPVYLAEDYDNVGLLVESEKTEIESVLISLDTDNKVTEEAKNKKCDMIISHHPLIFKPLKRVGADDCVFSLVKNNIALYAMHTNYDAVQGGLCDVLLNKICKCKDVMPLIGEESDSIGRFATLESEMSFSEFTESIKNALGLKELRVVGCDEARIKTVAICNGGGADFVYDAKGKGADVYISGDFKYHHARFGYENDIALLELSHYDAEIIFIDELAKLLEEKFADRLRIFKSEKNINPWKTV